ncbi:HEPN domain-containing protein [Bradyrhizobium sp. CCGUVB14]|uniref:HEPN domain-containing protein n=1 Tax=Bradyrhizobium sp. CCGUVB14 TaxID=2949628 RepID=UPI0020B24187|nr:HEPN domain-containing protein [Bradyrhizobium sp. CCGUVB14]MCP3444205.1 HEPN domain-containing protein [Bradyrhizobium sp. CCGUVB14]
MSRPIDIKPGYSATARAMTVPANFYSLAEEYLEAALALYEAPPAAPTGIVMRVWTGLPSPQPLKGTRAPLPMFFCFAQSAELFMKSFLLAKGITSCPGWNKHHLAPLLNAAAQAGLSFDEAAREIIVDLCDGSRDNQRRFQKNTAPIVLPPVDRTITAIQTLRDQVYPVVRALMNVREAGCP